MNKRFLICLSILISLPFMSTLCYAWPIAPEIYIWAWQKYTGVGDSNAVDIVAHCESGGPIVEWNWDWDAGLEGEHDPEDDEDYSSTATFWSDSPGKYEVDVNGEDGYGQWDHDWAEVYIIDVSLSGGGYIALNDRVQVGVSLSPSYPTLHAGKVVLDAISGGSNISVSYDSDGQYPCNLPATWYVVRQQVPSSVWVKGISTSSEPDDVVLRISYNNYGPDVDWNTVKFTVVDVQIITPTGTDYDDQFCFNDEPNGVCTISATGTTGVSALNAGLEWTLTEIDDPCTTLTAVPDPCVGPSVTFTYTGLPSSNSEFGKKTLTLEYSNTGIKDSIDLEIFFDPNATNNPGEDDGESDYPYPNWFYYWAKDRGFYYGADTSNNCGEYHDWDDTLWIYSSAFTYTELVEDTNIPLYNHRYQTNINTGMDGWANTTYIDDVNDTQILPFDDPNHNNTTVVCEPFSVAITAGPNGVIDSTPWGWCGHGPTNEHDDAIINSAEGEVLHTGFDGKLEILGGKSQYDDWKMYEYMGQQKNINNSYGRPWSISIKHKDDWLHTDPAQFDEIDLTGVEPVTFFLPKDCIGIELVDVVCTHELKHQELYNNVVTDSDSDMIDDDYELSSGYDLCPYKLDTYNMAEDFYSGEDHGPYDNEFLAFMSQGDGSGTSSSDWSVGGKQWHEE